MTDTPTTALVTGEGADRLRDALEYVTDHPERWDQSYWLRLTRDGEWFACLAGTLVLRAGFLPYVESYRRRVRSCTGDELVATVAVDAGFRARPGTTVFVDYDGGGRRYALVEDVAYRLLDVPAGVRVPGLFRASRTLAQLWAAAHAATDGAITPTVDRARRVLAVDRAVELPSLREQLVVTS